MPTITDSLVQEHAVLARLFDEISRLLPDVQTVAEARLLSRLVEGLLSHHADTEQNLAYAALDQALEERGELDRLYQDHQEIDAHLRRASAATDFAEALRLLKAGLAFSKEHFRWEEERVFPLIKKVFETGNLQTLGAAARQPFTSRAARPRKRAPRPVTKLQEIRNEAQTPSPDAPAEATPSWLTHRPQTRC